MRAAAALLFAALLIPALRPVSVARSPFPILLFVELARGTLVALAAAIPLWAATMAGGVVDALRGAQDPLTMPTVEGRATPLAVLFSLLSATLFLATGGPAHVVGALVAHPIEIESALVRAASDLAAGIGIAVAIAAPLIAASIIVEVAGALMARAASPAQLHAFLAPVRSLALLMLTALLFERITSFLAVLVQR